MSYTVEDYYDNEPDACPHCGGSVLWERCTSIHCDDGFVSDWHELDPLWYDEDYVTVCEMCEGKSGWYICLSSDCPAKATA